MPDEKGLLSRQEAASYLGVSASQIDNLVHRRQIERAGRGKFEQFELDRYKAGISPAHKMTQEVVKASGGQRNSKQAQDGSNGSSAVNPQSGSVLLAARTKNEVLKAQKAELDYLREKGDLIEREVVKQQCAAISRILANALRAMPRRVSGEIAILTDPKEVKDLLDTEIGNALEEAQNALAAL